MTEKRYNGWTNYETWLVKLWMDNEEGGYRAGVELAQEAWDGANAEVHFSREEVATAALAATLKDLYEEANPLGEGASVWVDLMSAALSEVNWYEIAEHMIEDVEKAEEAEAE